MLQREEIKKYESENLNIDCTQIKLTPMEESSNPMLKAPGSIIQKAGSGFVLKMFSSDEVPPWISFDRITRLEPGKTISKSEYYHMCATDWRGGKWESDWIYPNYHSGPSGTIITADLSYIQQVGSLPEKSTVSTIEIKFKGDLRIPANTVSRIEAKVGEKVTHKQSNINVCKFDSCGIDFEIVQEGEWTILQAISNKHVFDEGLAHRIQEMLQICTGRQLKWSSLKITKKDEEAIVLPGIRIIEKKGRVYPPINFSDMENIDDAIRLMSCYLEKTINCRDTSVHYLFYPLYEVILASQSSIESEALFLVVSVESILKYATNDFDFMDEETRQWIDDLKKKIQSCRSYPLPFRNRLLNLLGMMESPSAAEKLHALLKKGAIYEGHIQIWKSLRPKLAHGDTNFRSVQEFLDMCLSVRVLLYHLFFHCIGYQGKYTDYSSRGWPAREYPNSIMS